ncbi:MAG: CBS domain-containing protein [Verrucomicrobiia bacterium]
MTAKELVSRRFVRIGEGHSMAEAIGIIFDPEASALREIVIVVLASDGDYTGLIEPRDLLESLATDLSSAGEDVDAQIEALRRGLKVPVAEIARRNLPSVDINDGLATLLVLAARTEAAVLPVFREQQFVGVLHLSAIFSAVCKTTIAAEPDALPFMKGNEERST